MADAHDIIRYDEACQERPDLLDHDSLGFGTLPLSFLSINNYFRPLPYRSVHFRMETFDREYYQSNSVVNYPNNYDFTRIHEYKCYLNDRSDRTVIAKEYSEDFVPGRNDRFYPIPKEENVALYNRYLEAAKQKYSNMVFLGRLGDYKYYDMD